MPPDLLVKELSYDICLLRAQLELFEALVFGLLVLDYGETTGPGECSIWWVIVILFVVALGNV